MESRLRKLLSLKRSRLQPNIANSELDLHSIPYTTAQPQGRFPVFINHALGRPTTSKRTEENSNDIHCFSYNATVPGTPPEVGDRPQRGNGPVKLQTSRRLSSGELLVTQQDYDRTLEDIRHGEYIVGGKPRRVSRPPPPVNTNKTRQPIFVSTAPNSPGAYSTISSSVWSPQTSASDEPVSGSFTSLSPSALPVAQPQMAVSSSTEARFQDLEAVLTGRGSFAQSNASQLFVPNYMASTTSLLESNEERTPTIQALWKAEYSRLASIYSHAGMDRNVSEFSQSTSSIANPRLPQHVLPHRENTPSGLPALQSTPHLPIDLERRGLPPRSDVSASHLELDHSDSSSNIRYSLLSSSGASSSFTARTSIAEDSTTTREDVRRIVDDMRMTYLNVIEAQAPPLQPLPDLPSQKPRSKKKPRSLASSTSVESGLRSVNRQSGTRTKSWQSTLSSQSSITPRTSTSSPPTRSLNKRKSSGNSRRTSGHPVAGISSLPAIEASPSKSTPSARKKKDDVGLKRADSTTLGSMEKMLTILDDKKSNYPSRSATPASPRIVVSSEPENKPTTADVRTAPSPILETPPRRNSSLQSTPAKIEAVKSDDGEAATAPTWHFEAERLFEDADVDVSLDVDDFEALCNDLFSTPASAKQGAGSLGTWGRLPPADRHAVDSGIATGSPRKRAQTTTATATAPAPAGLGLSLLATSG